MCPLGAPPGGTCARGPFSMPLIMSRSPMNCSFRKIGRPVPRVTRAPLPAPRSGVVDHPVNHEAIPNEEGDERANGGRDETCALTGTIPADALADKSSNEGAGNPEHCGEDESGRIVRAGRK